MLDLPLRICSHKRSGTHLLAALLYENFEFEDVSIEAVVHAEKSFTRDGITYGVGNRVVIPWGKLWGTHNTYNPPWIDDPTKILYIVRHPVRTLMSYWKMMDPMAEEKEKFLGEDRIKFWYRHAKGYTQNGCYYVKYEDLVKKRRTVLNEIGEHYCIKKKRFNYRGIKNRVGWSSDQSPVPREKLDKDTIERFKDIIPEGFLGYDIDIDNDYHKGVFNA